MGAINFSIDRKLLQFFHQQTSVTTFVETGTYHGDSLNEAADIFCECHSIELSQELYSTAVTKFAGRTNLKLHQGESSKILPILNEQFLGCPVIFWLDAHWCVGENTSGQNSQSPLLDELRTFKKLHPESVILIDDARLYLCPPPEPHRFTDWPDFQDIVVLLQSLSPCHRLMILNDVIMFYPERIQPDMAMFARQQGVDWLDLVNNARKAFVRLKHKSLFHRLGFCQRLEP